MILETKWISCLHFTVGTFLSTEDKTALLERYKFIPLNFLRSCFYLNLNFVKLLSQNKPVSIRYWFGKIHCWPFIFNQIESYEIRKCKRKVNKCSKLTLQCVFEHFDFDFRLGKHKFRFGVELMLLDLLTHSRAFRLLGQSFFHILRSLLKSCCYRLHFSEILWTIEEDERFRKLWKFLIVRRLIWYYTIRSSLTREGSQLYRWVSEWNMSHN